MIFGRLFGIQALIDSGLIVKQSTTLEDFKQIIVNLTDLGRSKVWLKEATGWTTLNVLKQITKNNVSWLADAIDVTLDILFQGEEKDVWGPEKLGILLWLEANHKVR